MNKVNFMAKNRKEGSALLIVLGFLSFMIVSAVAFSIYMRAERLPSSALRRTVATRQLAKAALAEAIARIDDAVRGSPFPGLNDNDTKGYQPRGDTENHWYGRVFMPPNPGYSGNQRYYAPAPQTVSVLTIEGLGYVPPPLVNDARFLGRSTWTAAWENLPYDAGRFAFMALNVSDYFDVNRLYADKPRTSNADGRISLAYLLDQGFRPLMNKTGGESTSVDGFQDGSTKQFDQLVHDQREGGNDSNPVGKDAPFVSMLDYQLSLKTGISGVMPSLFYNWIEQKGVDKVFYTSGDANLQAAGRQPFVTESVATNESYEVDIAYYQAPNGKKQKGQPFDTEVAQDTMSFMQVNAKAASSKFFTPLTKPATTVESTIKFANGLQGLSMIAALLYDYLDHNDIPLSLAWPCIERVPMLAAIEPAFQVNVPQIQPSGSKDQTIWEFDPNMWLGSGMLSAVWTFPFKRNEADRNDNFKAQALVRIFLAPEGLSMRAAEGLGQLLRPQNDAEWKQKGDMFKVGNQNNVFCLTLVLNEQSVQIPNNIRTEEEAGGVLQFPINIGALGNVQKVPLVTRIQEKDPATKQEVYKYTINVSPLGLDGKPMFQVGQVIEQAQFNATANTILRPYAAVWMRIVNGDNKTVDLVPAVVEDDQQLNNGNTMVPALSEYLLQGQDGPLLRFTGSAKFSYADMVNSQAAAAQSTWEPASFSTVDPRYNWAPEDWYVTEAGMTTYQKWLDKAHSYLDSAQAENNGCDYDIFCAVSNQGFLQSLGEFAFLPRVTDPYNNGIPLLAVRQAANGYDGRQRASAQEIANKACAWATYDMNFEMYEAFNQMGIGRSTSNECLVNPYTPERDILMAALANTPCDYWAAGVALDEENELKSRLGDKELPKIKTATEGLKYAFSENKSQNGQARIRYTELENIAGVIQSAFRNEGFLQEGKGKVGTRQTSDAWKYIWDQKLNWWPDRNNPDFYQFLGTKLEEPLYGIDRKFLNSYWRDCFGNQQQLFLIFVRAESSAIGGPGEGTPAQKGARAVALVWRNPVATSDTSTGPDGRQGDQMTGWVDDRRPHQTRILFYHQFD